MAVLLNKGYVGYLQGTTVELPLDVEKTLIAQQLAQAAVRANITPGNVTANTYQGMAAIATGATSVNITCDKVVEQSVIMAVVSQATADGTLLRVERVVPTNGSFTIYGTAAATAPVLVKWVVLSQLGMAIVN